MIGRNYHGISAFVCAAHETGAAFFYRAMAIFGFFRWTKRGKSGILLDRRKAIQKAIDIAKDNDMVLILGKGICFLHLVFLNFFDFKLGLSSIRK